jgi:two-component system, LuxR family, response regulator FixJ
MLLDCVQRALEKDAQNRREQTGRASIRMRLAQLTQREREVMERVVLGLSDKAIRHV